MDDVELIIVFLFDFIWVMCVCHKQKSLGAVTLVNYQRKYFFLFFVELNSRELPDDCTEPGFNSCKEDTLKLL